MTQALQQAWNSETTEKTVDEEICELVEAENWKSPNQLYQEYRHYKKDPVHFQTFYKYLNELESLGELEARGGGHSREYRKSDKPVQEVREDYSSPLSEGLPDFIEKRIQAEVEKRVKKEIERLEGEVQQRILIENNQEAEKEQKEQVSEKDQTEKTLKVLQEAEEELKSSQVRERFNQRYSDEASQRTIRRYLKNLADRGLVKKEGSKRGRTYKA